MPAIRVAGRFEISQANSRNPPVFGYSVDDRYMRKSIGNLLPILALFLACVPAEGATSSVSFVTPWAKYKLTFNPSIISEDQVRKYARLSPQDAYADSIPELEYCPTDCGFDPKKQWRNPGFYKNAELNIAIAKKQLQILDSEIYPDELKPVFAYLHMWLTFNLWEEETRLEFYKSWDPQILKRRFQELEPSRLCPGVLRQIENSHSRDEMYLLAKFRWGTCLSAVYVSHIGAYPTKNWEQFLSAYGIKQEVEPPPDDSDVDD